MASKSSPAASNGGETAESSIYYKMNTEETGVSLNEDWVRSFDREGWKWDGPQVPPTDYLKSDPYPKTSSASTRRTEEKDLEVVQSSAKRPYEPSFVLETEVHLPTLPSLGKTQTQEGLDFRVPIRSKEAPISGAYVSKRQRAALASRNEMSDPNPIHAVRSSVVGSLSESDVPHGIIASLRHCKWSNSLAGHETVSLSVSLSGHSKAVNALQWSRTHHHLLASAGMDSEVRIWNAWSRVEKQARTLKCHNAAVKDVKWSPQGLSVLSCGYDYTSRLIDVEKGMETRVFNENQIVEVVKFNPNNHNVFISGGSKGQLKLWDIRAAKVVHEYIQSLGPILDVEFTNDGKHLITSSDVSKSNISENSIIVWDIAREVPLSKQVYAEAYTCTCIRSHPYEPYFVAQSNGNYIAIFSTYPPFRLNKYKRYEGHGVSGFPIKCNFSADGKTLASGSSEGLIYLYDSKTSNLRRKIRAYDHACIDIAFHPSVNDVVASCSWNGAISVHHLHTSKN